MTPDLDLYRRQLAGVLLKNVVRKLYGALPEPVKMAIKQTVLRALGDPHVPVRRAVALVATTVVSKEQGFTRWPGLLEGLVQTLQSTDASPAGDALRDGALCTVELLCEDATRELQDHPMKPLNVMVPVLIAVVRNSAGTSRLRALHSLNFFLVDFPNAIKVNASALLEAVFASANDKDGRVTQQVCRTFCTLAELRPDYLGPYLGSVLAFMMAQLDASRDDDTRTEAADFWAEAVEQVAFQAGIREKVPQLLPLLLAGIVYSSDEVETLLERDDATVPLPDRDVKPFFAKNRLRHNAGGRDEDAAQGGEARAGDSVQWTLRRASANALDNMCVVYGDAILAVLFPLLRDRLQSADWRVREGAILALGASADGTIGGMVPMLPQLTASLMGVLTTSSSHPLLAATSCWTLARLSSWIVRPVAGSGPGAEPPLLQPLVAALCSLVGSKSRRVQEASCSALGVLAEETWGESKRTANAPHNVLLLPFAGALLTSLMAAYPHYQAKALLIFYDTLHGVLERLPNEDGMHRATASVVLPPMMQCWQALGDSDRRLIPLMNCLCTVALHTRVAFQSAGAPVMQRSLQLAAMHMNAFGAYSRATAQLQTAVRAQRPEVSANELKDIVAQEMGSELPYDLDFVVASLDLVSAVVDALGPAAGALLQPFAAPLVQLVGDCMGCSNVPVKQAVFALVGDLCREAYDIIAPASTHMVPLLIDNLYGSYTDLCVNAVWALGELADRMGPAIAPKVDEAATRIARLLRAHRDPLLLRNLAITMARLSTYNAAPLALQLEDLAAHWLPPLCQVKFGAERDRAHAACLAVLQSSPATALQQLSRVCSLMHSWGKRTPPPLVRQRFVELMSLLRTSPQWAQQWALVPIDVQQYCMALAQ